MTEFPFCNGPFWDPDLAWNATNPSLTQCMRDTVLIGIPSSILWVTGPFWIYHSYLKRMGRGQPNLSFLFITKLLMTLVLITNAVGELWYRVNTIGWNNMHGSDLFQPMCLLSTYGIAATMVLIEKVCLSHTSPPQFFFWLTLLIGTLPTFKFQIDQTKIDPMDYPLIFLTTTFVPVIFLQLILSCWADLDEEPVWDNPPVESASLFSHLFFGWVDPLMYRGFQRPLTETDVPKAPETLNVTKNVYEFLTNMQKSFSSQLQSSAPGSPSIKLNVWAILFKTYGVRIALLTLVEIAHYSLAFVNPIMLKFFIRFLSNNEPCWRGVLYALTMFVGSMLWTLTFHQSCYLSVIISSRMRSSLVSMIYRKTLKLNNKARNQFTAGEITNYMSVDAQRVMDNFWHLRNIWGTPFQVSIALYLIYQELGAVTFAGIGIMLALIPVNLYTSKISESLDTEYLGHKDERLKLMTEILNGIKVLKMFAWEMPFIKRINLSRYKEIQVLKRAAKVWASTMISFSASPFLTTVTVFGLYTLSDPAHLLTADMIFVTISLFNIMRLPLTYFPMSLMESVKLVVSIQRIGKFLNADELDEGSDLEDLLQPQDAIVIKDGCFTWLDGNSTNDSIRNIDMKIKQGSLVAVAGSVGAGKSSILSAILGDMVKTKGSISKSGSLGYVPQQAWIQNMTLRENILFDKELQFDKYNQILEACALRPDLLTLPSGDMTEIGENGVNISGGQRQRVALARAVYADADLYLLDDPLSAVDVHVGKHIFERVLSSENGLLRNQTRVLVTHKVDILDKVDHIFVVKDGVITEQGSYDELLNSSGAFSDFLQQYKEDSSAVEEDTFHRKSLSEDHHDSSHPQVSDMDGDNNDESASLIPDNRTGGTLVQEEESETGVVHWSIFYDYLRRLGIPTGTFCFMLYVFSVGMHTFSNYWLSRWADDNDSNNNHSSHAHNNTGYYLGIYTGMGLIEVASDFTRELLLFLASAKAAKITHDKLLGGVMRSPMSFFDTHPMGRITNRFSADIDGVDQKIPYQLTDFCYCFCEVMAVLVVISCTLPYFILALIPLAVFYYFVQKYYVATSRQLKRIECSSKSPIFSHFSESITGASSIRAFGQQQRFIAESEARQSINVKCFYTSQAANRWLGCRIESVGNTIIFITALLIIVAGDRVSPGLAALALTYAIQCVESLNWMIRMVSDLETNAVALERIKEYSDVTPEAAYTVPSVDQSLPGNWPQTGSIQFENYETSYRQGLDPVLKGFNLTIHSKEKLGVCGRTGGYFVYIRHDFLTSAYLIMFFYLTGAGKSSVALALLRIIEPTRGRILIDNVDISLLGLQYLRSRISIIPQDPILFTGSLRFNLDPSEQHTDQEVWHSLEHAHLKEHVMSLGDGLYHEVSEGGSNFSVGQRQLICLARALLRKTKIVILDEATAAVDLETDDLIQATIRKELTDCTVLTIAHRLNTIMDSDRIAVLDEGKVLEIDEPNVLLAQEESVLRSMIQESSRMNSK